MLFYTEYVIIVAAELKRSLYALLTVWKNTGFSGLKNSQTEGASMGGV
jgi:hypothetical protein